MKHVFRLLQVLILMVFLTACASSSGQTGANGGERIYSRLGNGRPAVVLQAGFGDGKAVWQPVMAELARDFTVFAYDRPGRGDNPDTDAPRDPCSIADEQRALLKSAGISPPYVLVGHSLGGLYQYVYAKLYPDEVAGFVLLDPTHPRNWQMVQKTNPAIATLIKTMLTLRPGRAQSGEFNAQTQCLDRLDMKQALKAPGKILVSRRYRREEEGDFAREVQKLQQEWLAMTGVGELDILWDSGHYIQAEKPEDVIEAIQLIAGVTPVAKRPAQSVPLMADLTMEVGVTTQADVRGAIGQPDEIRQNGGQTIWIYGKRPAEMPFLVGFIPIVGDVAEVIDLAQSMQDHYETIIQFDSKGIVTKVRRRKLT